MQIRAVTLGRVVDYRVRDITNMGAAMAPAAAATLLRYLADTSTRPGSLDCIYTGDLGRVGSRLLGRTAGSRGGSPAIITRTAAACSMGQTPGSAAAGRAPAAVPASCRPTSCPKWRRGSWGGWCFIATGALMSQTTFLQKETIPAVAHLVELAAPAPIQEE